MKVHLVTFADGGEGYVVGKNSLLESAKQSGWFVSTTSYCMSRLAFESPQWYESNREFISNNPRGFGYWIWKPEVIRLCLSKIEPNEVLLYLDAGCQINHLAAARFKYYTELTLRYEMLCFYLHGSNYSVKQWTKGDLLKKFKLHSKHKVMSMPQVEAGVVFYKNTPETINCVEEWGEICASNNYRLLDDCPSISTNEPEFIQHRHDQSIFTLLHYSRLWGKSMRNESYFPAQWAQGYHPRFSPICASRFVNPDRPSLHKLSLGPDF